MHFKLFTSSASQTIHYIHLNHSTVYAREKSIIAYNSARCFRSAVHRISRRSWLACVFPSDRFFRSIRQMSPHSYHHHHHRHGACVCDEVLARCIRHLRRSVGAHLSVRRGWSCLHCPRARTTDIRYVSKLNIHAR